ncbi:MAG TPA: hypothetical protein VF771_00075 [Longimicrobiaceae bacterium]
MNERVQILLQSRQLEERSAPDAEVRSAWEKAIATRRSVETTGRYPESDFSLIYQSALQASTAVLRCAGYRTRGGDHHHNTFTGVAAIGAGELSRAGRDLDDMRPVRREAVYATQIAIGADDVAELRQRTDRLFSEAYRFILDSRPALATDLEKP